MLRTSYPLKAFKDLKYIVDILREHSQHYYVDRHYYSKFVAYNRSRSFNSQLDVDDHNRIQKHILRL